MEYLERSSTTTTTKPLISNKLEYVRNKTQSKNIMSKISNINDNNDDEITIIIIIIIIIA
jgi:hypothetical protein